MSEFLNIYLISFWSIYLWDLVDSPAERISQTVDIIRHTVSIEEKGIKLKLSIIDTPGFGDAINNTER